MGLVWNALFSIVWDWIIFPVANFLTLYRFDAFFMGAFGMNANGCVSTSLPPPPTHAYSLLSSALSSYEGAWTGSRMRRKLWNGNSDNRMFMVGVLLANVFYRDGKKYQGVLGWVNSWYAFPYR
jgi:hypothetical protein